jgi:hypothetical protein
MHRELAALAWRASRATIRAWRPNSWRRIEASCSRRKGLGLEPDRLAGAQRHMPEALEWYRQGRRCAACPTRWRNGRCAPPCARRTGVMVRATIERCRRRWPEQPTWIYWLGRAYRAGGRPTRPTRCSRASPGSRISTATWPTKNSGGRLPRRQRPRRRPKKWRRWPHGRRCGARWRCCASTCASKACANGTGRCAA